ncbi:hypothetical protein [Mariniphaga sp.]|uniref:hypothetical protein n=1 Tax=Mariniphaga sp. TaxID=1954475 RepID=UPI0035624D1C
MKTTKFILLLVFILTGTRLLAVNPAKENALSMGFGIGQNTRQDQIFSPFVHHDFSLLNGAIDYSRNGKYYQQVKIVVATFDPMLQEPYNYSEYDEVKTATPHYFLYFNLDYLFGRKVIERGKTDLTIGGMFNTDTQSLNYVYGRIGSFGYFSAINLGVFGKLDFLISEKNGLTIKLQLPAVSWVSRSPYLVNDDEFIENISSHSGVKTFFAFIKDGNPATWNTVQQFDFELKYLYQFLPKWGIGIAGQYEFIHAQKPRNLISQRSSVNISATFKF